MDNTAYLQAMISEPSIEVKRMEEYAEENRIPIMEPLGIDFLMQMVRLKQPERILEIGTAIGYSALRMLEAYPKSQIVSVERDSVRFKEAQANIAKLGAEPNIHLIQGDALDVVPEVEEKGPFDLLFIDAAKGKYEEFFHLYAPFVSDDGMILSDNVLFKGYVANREQAPERLGKIAAKIDEFNQRLIRHPDYNTTIVPVGDGVAVTIKNKKS
ncbi:O-methyltransferase [Halobacillus salinarum]|uniref:tRNA 5-hydroxyuridine methyltransferase n=1 Tax=Halobacillus salinarum TaxID=2932257 RepID=A0ABY4EPB1_9BACI|nr:O-methyltransferase [Halobacillus salinarum]UOQ46300.1 O-methyltransferase [Halobacillus salinarum]